MARTLQTPQQRRSDALARLLATGFGCGYSPVAPGTVGSLVGVVLFWTSKSLERISGVRFLTLGLGWAVLSLGIWAASRVITESGTKDPPSVVIDEIAGQIIALLLTPQLDDALRRGLYTQAAVFSLLSFAAFRLFDILKPYPIRRLEQLRSGLGIMADDVMAGLYAGVLLHLSVLLGSFVPLF